MSTANDIATQARYILNDAGVHWDDAEMLTWINQAQSVIAMLRPDATSVLKVLTLAAGTKQSISDMKLLDVIRNVAADGVTPGRPVRLVERVLLDAIETWHTETSASYISNYAFDERSPQTFWCYPPAQAGIKVEALVSVAPGVLTNMAQSLTLPSIYDAPVMDYVLYRAFQKGTSAGSHARSARHLESFAVALGQEAAAKITTSPNAVDYGAARK